MSDIFYLSNSSDMFRPIVHHHLYSSQAIFLDSCPSCFRFLWAESALAATRFKDISNCSKELNKLGVKDGRKDGSGFFTGGLMLSVRPARADVWWGLWKIEANDSGNFWRDLLPTLKNSIYDLCLGWREKLVGTKEACILSKRKMTFQNKIYKMISKKDKTRSLDRIFTGLAPLYQSTLLPSSH